jgi:hypothetical protein
MKMAVYRDLAPGSLVGIDSSDYMVDSSQQTVVFMRLRTSLAVVLYYYIILNFNLLSDNSLNPK